MNVFDLTLLWPIRLSKDGFEGNLPELATRALHTRGWKSVNDPLSRGGTPEFDGYAAAELAFFHTFIRRLLYGARTPRERPFELYRYELPPDARLTIHEGAWHDAFSILDLWFYVMDDCSAIMVLQLTSPNLTDWDSVLNAISYLRTVHYQHYKLDDEARWTGGGAPDQVIIDGFETDCQCPKRGDELQAVIQRKEPALLDHWKAVLKPLIDQGIHASPIGDYRMAVMAFIGTPTPETLTDDEWFGLAEADAAGFKRYAPKFRDSRLAESTYDRWWSNDPNGECRDRSVAGPLTLARVVAVDSSEGHRPPWLDRVRTTWWRQYFQIFFLAHFQRAALMILQARVAEATQFVAMSRSLLGLWRLGNLLGEVERDMAVFSSRFWFSEVSPQAQGQDLFRFLRTKIRSDELYRGVIEDKSLLGDWVRTRYWDLINGLVLPIGLYFTAAGVLTGPLSRLAGWFTYRFVPATGSLLTPDLRDSITQLLTVFVFGALFLASWRLVWRTRY